MVVTKIVFYYTGRVNVIELQTVSHYTQIIHGNQESTEMKDFSGGSRKTKIRLNM